MYLKNISIFICILIAVFFQCCTRKVICYDLEHCLQKYQVSLIIEEKSNFLSLVLNNNGYRKIGPIDSLSLQFYRNNINLQQNLYDSTLSNTPGKMFITGVLYEQPIKFFSKNFSNNLIINAYDKYTINVPDQSLKDAVNNFGNEDNKTQAKNKFQIFLVGYRNNKIVYHIASSFFKIYWQH